MIYSSQWPSAKTAAMENSRKYKSLQNPTRPNHTNKNASEQFPTMNNQPLLSLRTGCNQSKNLLTRFVLLFACLLVLTPTSAAEEEFPKKKCETALPECHCEEGYIVAAELICSNMSNFDAFTRTLSKGSVFKVNTTYDISLFGVQVLPRGFLKRLVVQRLYIDDIQTEVVEDGAFDGILQLKKFQVKLSSIQEIPNFRPIRDSLRYLYLDNSRLTSISGDRLKNLTKLQTVSFVNNSIQSVASDAFEGTENVIIFDLSCNQLKVLPQNLFNSWKRLLKVSLTSNQLLHVDQLFAVAHPKFIYLDHNSLTDLDSILYPNMSEVQTLLLSYNPFSKITENSFNGKVKNIAFLYMDHCLIREFNASHFKDLSRLQTLDLSYNVIENITNQTIQFGSVIDTGLELIFTGNKIHEFSVNLTYKVKHVNLNKNLLTLVSRALWYSQVFDVEMAENHIETLGPEDFHGVQGIQNVELQGNFISTVDTLTFQGIRRDLVSLDLSRNRIRSLQGCVRNLYLLTSLNLTGNKIEFFEEDEFQGLGELLVLYLDGNHLTTLGNEMRLLTQLQLLSIRKNKISTLTLDQITQTLKFLYLEGNPFQCDCQLLPFLQYLNFSSVGTDGQLCTPSNQTYLLPPAKCPDGCHCFCTQNNGKHFMSVDCSFAGLIELPRLFTSACSSTAKENCSSMVINLPRFDQFSQSSPFAIEDEIGGVNLSHNNLQSLDGAQLPGGIRHLFLDNNHLQKPPLYLLHSLKNLNTLTLSGNPWSCDCDLLSFKESILIKSDIVTDAYETRCGSEPSGLSGRVIWSLTDMDLCPDSTGSETSLVIGLSFFLVFSMATFLMMLYWANVKMWLFDHGVTCFREYDAIQNREAENLQANEQGERGTDVLVSFPAIDDNPFPQETSWGWNRVVHGRW